MRFSCIKSAIRATGICLVQVGSTSVPPTLSACPFAVSQDDQDVPSTTVDQQAAPINIQAGTQCTDWTTKNLYPAVERAIQRKDKILQLRAKQYNAQATAVQSDSTNQAPHLYVAVPPNTTALCMTDVHGHASMDEGEQRQQDKDTNSIRQTDALLSSVSEHNTQIYLLHSAGGSADTTTQQSYESSCMQALPQQHPSLPLCSSVDHAQASITTSKVCTNDLSMPMTIHSQQLAAGAGHPAVDVPGHLATCPHRQSTSSEASFSSQNTPYSRKFAFSHIRDWRQLRHAAATVIQAHVRGYLCRVHVEQHCRQLYAANMLQQWRVHHLLQAWYAWSNRRKLLRHKLAVAKAAAGSAAHLQAARWGFSNHHIVAREGKTALADAYRRWRTRAVVVWGWAGAALARSADASHCLA